MLVLIAANALFVAAEFAMVAVDRSRVDVLAQGGSRRARLASSILRRLSFNLSGAQLGITVTSLVLGFIAEPTVAEALRPALGGLPPAVEDGVAIVAALALVTVVQMVLGELVPKGVAIAEPLATVLAVAGAMRSYGVVFGPLIRLLNGAADWAVRHVGIEPQQELSAVRSLEELDLLILSSGRAGTLDAAAAALLTRTIRFGNKTAADALVPRVAMVTVPATASVAELSRAAIDTGHTRFPVVGDDPDDIRGVAHAKDVLRVPTDQRETTAVGAVTREAHFVPEGRDLESLLTELRAPGVQLAVVVDEYGGTAGIVTLEDLLEEIVGEIEDEHDPVSPRPDLTASLPSGTSVLEGTTHLDEVRDLTGLALPEGQYETLAGFLLDRLGHLPEAGERVVHDGWELQVLAMERRRIAQVQVVAPEGDGAGPRAPGASPEAGSR